MAEFKLLEMIAAGGDLATLGLFIMMLRLSGRIVRLETVIEMFFKEKKG